MILVTGAAGFIGQNLVKALVEQGHEVVGTYRTGKVKLRDLGATPILIDLNRINQVKFLFSKYKPDVIFHLAANPMTKLDLENPNDIIHDNIIATHNLLFHCPNKCKFINTSSVLVYGDFMFSRAEYDMCHPTSLYAATKIATEDLVNIYVGYKGIQGINLRLSAVVGENSSHGLLHDIIRKIKENDVLTLIGQDPGTTKPYLHINDVVDSYVKCLTYDKCGTFNISGEPAISVREVAETAIRAIGKSIPIQFGESTWAGDNPLVQCDNSLARSELGWSPKYNSLEAIDLVCRS